MAGHTLNHTNNHHPAHPSHQCPLPQPPSSLTLSKVDVLAFQARDLTAQFGTHPFRFLLRDQDEKYSPAFVVGVESAGWVWVGEECGCAARGSILCGVRRP
jgi:hypothetical protein